MKKTQKGFTLVELLVVIAILAILATVSVVGYTSFIDRAEESNAQTEAHQIKTAITSALVIPGDTYTIATVNGTVITIKQVNGTYVVTNMPEGGIDLKGANVTSDFAGLKGKLKVESNSLVYVPDSGADHTQTILAVGSGS